MTQTKLPPGSFYGRTAELSSARRLIEKRTGDLLGFSGIGGIGKSELLARIAAEAQRLKVTPYVVLVTIDPDMTPVGFYRAVIEGLRATGRTDRRRLMVLREDLLKPCDTLLKRLEQQEISLGQCIQTKIVATQGGSIGGVEIGLEKQSKIDSVVSMRDFQRAFQQLVSRALPDVVSLPSGISNYLPQRLLVLLVDNLEQAQPDLLNVVQTLRSGSLTERVLLFCAGRFEPNRASDRPAQLLTHSLERLDQPSCEAWLSRSGITDQTLRTAINNLCQGVPLLLKLCIAEVEVARSQGETMRAEEFTLPAPEADDGAAIKVVEEFLVGRFIERFERAGREGLWLSLLVRYGCVLPDFRDRDAVRALQIEELPGDIDRPLRALDGRGLLRGAALHPVVRQSALARLAQREARFLQTLCTRAAGYYADAGQPVASLAMRLQADDAEAATFFTDRFAVALQAGDVTMAERLIRVAGAAAPHTDMAWRAALARIDLASVQGDKTTAEARAAEAVGLAGDWPERIAALEERIRRLEPLQNADLLLWWLPRQPYSPETLGQLLALGGEFVGAYHYRRAVSLLHLALAMAERIADRRGSANALHGLGAALLQQDEPRAAQAYLEQALEASRSIDDRLGIARALDGLGDALRMQDEPRAAQAYYQQALETSRAIDSRRGIADALRGLGETLLQQDEPRAAQEYYQQALEASRAIDSRRGIARALRGLGAALRRQDEPRAAQAYYQQALETSRAIDDRLGIAAALRGLGAALLQQGEPRAAQAYYQQALEAYRAIDSRRGIANALRGLGAALLQQDEPRAAQAYLEQALEAYRAIDDRLGIANALRGLGAALRMQGEPRAAQAYYQQALEAYRAIDSRLGIAHALRGLGEALLGQEQPAQAQAYLEQALEAYRAIDSRLGSANALYGLGESLLGQEQPAQAQAYLEQALALGREIQYRWVQFKALKALIAIAEDADDHDAVAQYRQEYQYLLVDKR